MPNWCSNYVIFKNENELLLQQLVDAYNSGELMQNFRPCPHELKNTVAGSPPGEEARAENDRKKSHNLREYGVESWYEWQAANWGTKWDVGREDREPEAKLKRKKGVSYVELQFDSAWSPPIAFYEYMRAELGFDIEAYYFEPGVGFCGVLKNDNDEYFDIEEFKPNWLADHIPTKILKVFNMIESAEENEADERAWEESQKAKEAQP